MNEPRQLEATWKMANCLLIQIFFKDHFNEGMQFWVN